MQSAYALEIQSPEGEMLAIVDQFEALDYILTTNGVPVLNVTLTEDFNFNLLRLDGRVLVRRHVAEPGTPGVRTQAETPWPFFIRYRARGTDENGRKGIVVKAFAPTHLLASRNVAYNAGTTQASKSGKAGDVMKAIVRENLGNLATDTARDLSAWLSVQADKGDGATVEKKFARQEVLSTLRDLALQSANGGTLIYFDIVANGILLEFQTYTGQRGRDRGLGSDNPLILSVKNGTLADLIYEEDARDEENYIYAGGQGEESARTIKTAQNDGRIRLSPFNRREGWVEARQYATDSGVQAAADTELYGRRARRRISGTVVNSPGAVYGLHWRWGDKAVVADQDIKINCRIETVGVSVTADKEDIRAVLRGEL